MAICILEVMDMNHLNTKKYKFYHIILAVVITMITTIFLVNLFKAKISVGAYGKDNNQFGDNKNYEMGYNSYGKPIFKNVDLALKQLKTDCSDGLEYLKQYRKTPEINTSFKALQKYAISCMQRDIQENIDNEEKVKSDMVKIQSFVYLCWNSNIQHYGLFSKNLS